MASGKLFQDSGSTVVDRADEAGRILQMLDGREHLMNEDEERFVTNTRKRVAQYGLKTIVSLKQLFSLRDIKEKYLWLFGFQC